LHEIILVDDFSDKKHLQQKLERFIQKYFPSKVSLVYNHTVLQDFCDESRLHLVLESFLLLPPAHSYGTGAGIYVSAGNEIFLGSFLVRNISGYLNTEFEWHSANDVYRKRIAKTNVIQ
jgi:hypothetical protein